MTFVMTGGTTAPDELRFSNPPKSREIGGKDASHVLT